MKILCIDFNIIMSPCIRLYADKVMLNENATTLWGRLEDEMGINAYLSYDAKILLDIAKIVGKAKALGKSVFILDSQKEIVDRIETAIRDETEADAQSGVLREFPITKVLI